MSFDIFKHPDVRRALELRKEGKYKEAIVFLDKACNEGDGEAWYIKGFFYQHGGCGLRLNGDKSTECFEKSVVCGCLWDVEIIDTTETALDDVYVKARRAYVRDDIYLADDLYVTAAETGYFFAAADTVDTPIETCELLADNGDGMACLQVAEHYYDKSVKKAICYDRKGAIQKVFECWCRLAHYYNPSEGISAFESITWEIKIADTVELILDVIVACEEIEVGRQQAAFYMIGRKVAKHFNDNSDPKLTHVLEVYQTTWALAHHATVTFLLCCRRCGIYKDVAKIIGKLIWQSRGDPNLWKSQHQNKKMKY